MTKTQFAGLAFAAAIGSAALPAQATVAVVFDSFSAGIADFNAIVTGAGSTVNSQVLTDGESASYAAFTITRNDGTGTASVGSVYELFLSSPATFTSGGTIDISPSGSGPGIGAKESGITFTFTSGINALGFEVGDWATCCQPSDLYIQFGSNAPILVGESDTFGDQFLTNGGAGVFVAALDDTDTFTTVSFWGDGFGEFLVMGGTILFATLDRGTLPGVPAPAAIGLFGFALAGLLAARRRKA
jgi:hypothetical protein